MDRIRKKKIANANPFGLPNRIWLFLLGKVKLIQILLGWNYQRKIEISWSIFCSTTCMLFPVKPLLKKNLLPVGV